GGGGAGGGGDRLLALLLFLLLALLARLPFRAAAGEVERRVVDAVGRLHHRAQRVPVGVEAVDGPGRVVDQVHEAVEAVVLAQRGEERGAVGERLLAGLGQRVEVVEQRLGGGDVRADLTADASQRPERDDRVAEEGREPLRRGGQIGRRAVE